MDPWWEELFGELWADALLESPPDPRTVWRQAFDISLLLGLSPGQRVLDVPSGAGRLALALASRGLSVTGVDLEPRVIAASRAESARQGLDVELLEGNMRSLPFESRFDAVLCVRGSFGYFTDEENAEVARGLFRALRPGGRLLLEMPCVETLLPRFQPRSVQTIAGGVVYELASYDPETSRVESSWCMVRGPRVSRCSSSIRLYSLRELRALLREQGFERIEAYGSLAGTPFRFAAETLALVAARPADPGTQDGEVP
jgi:SAM-dependent methyltransferase